MKIISGFIHNIAAFPIVNIDNFHFENIRTAGCRCAAVHFPSVNICAAYNAFVVKIFFSLDNFARYIAKRKFYGLNSVIIVTCSGKRRSDRNFISVSGKNCVRKIGFRQYTEKTFFIIFYISGRIFYFQSDFVVACSLYIRFSLCRFFQINFPIPQRCRLLRCVNIKQMFTYVAVYFQFH